MPSSRTEYGLGARRGEFGEASSDGLASPLRVGVRAKNMDALAARLRAILND